MPATTTIREPVLQEEVTRRVFPSGLTVYVVRKPDFTKSYATVASHYGSVDRRLDGRRLPDGVAHFLEHKVFETPEGDAFDLFAARGASANAFTSFTSTRYLFGTSRDYAGNLRVLLDMVFHLRVSDEGVEKEKGIIGQEIAMYADDPDWRIYFGGLQALYRRHPLRIDIAGTAKTISGITAPLLRAIHRHYYHPANMALAAVSPMPVRETFEVVEEIVEAGEYGPCRVRARPFVHESPRAFRPRAVVRLPVKRPRLLVAFKDRPLRRGGLPHLRREIASALALDCLFGNSGTIYVDLYEAGLIDESFSYNYTADHDHAFGLVGGETDDTGRLHRALERRLSAVVREGLPGDVFERVRNKALGDYARAFNSPESIAHMLVGHHFRGTTIADYRRALLAIRPGDLDRRVREILTPGARTYSLVLPR